MSREQPASKSLDPQYQAGLLAPHLLSTHRDTCCDLGGDKGEGQGSLWAPSMVSWKRPLIGWPETQIHKKCSSKIYKSPNGSSLENE